MDATSGAALAGTAEFALTPEVRVTDYVLRAAC